MRTNCDCAECYDRGARFEAIRVAYFNRLGSFYASQADDAEARRTFYFAKLLEMDIGLTPD